MKKGREEGNAYRSQFLSDNTTSFETERSSEGLVFC